MRLAIYLRNRTYPLAPLRKRFRLLTNHSARMDLQIHTIAKVSLDCQKYFLALGDALEITDGGKHRDELSGAEVKDELGRFRIWAGNIGALKTGRASLDYRLRDVGYLHQNVASLLEGLRQSLSEGLHSSYLSRSDLIATFLIKERIQYRLLMFCRGDPI